MRIYHLQLTQRKRVQARITAAVTRIATFTTDFPLPRGKSLARGKTSLDLAMIRVLHGTVEKMTMIYKAL
jgi:hypothetical protein